MALPKAALDSGGLSTVHCFPTFDDALRAVGIDPSALSLAAARRSLGAKRATAVRNGLVGIHYVDTGGGGASLSVGGTACDGGGISFAAGSFWNDVISSTRHQGCGKVKHFTNNDYSGSAQLTEGGFGTCVNLTAPLNDQSSSIRYYEPYL